MLLTFTLMLTKKRIMIQKLRTMHCRCALSFIFQMVFFFISPFFSYYCHVIKTFFIYHPSIDGMLRVLILKPNQPSNY